jgi:LysM repeat protein
VVKGGDTLSAIAARLGVSIAALAALNHLADQNQIAPGQTLLIPPAPPATLIVTPAKAPAGNPFQLRLTGAKAGETVTFTITAPGQGPYKGPPHIADQNGTVTATYQTGPADPAGTYHITATGDQGTALHAVFTLDATGPTRPPDLSNPGQPPTG